MPHSCLHRHPACFLLSFHRSWGISNFLLFLVGSCRDQRKEASATCLLATTLTCYPKARHKTDQSCPAPFLSDTHMEVLERFGKVILFIHEDPISSPSENAPSPGMLPPGIITPTEAVVTLPHTWSFLRRWRGVNLLSAFLLVVLWHP